RVTRGWDADPVRRCLRAGLFKTELIKPRGPWRTVEQVEIATLEYVGWFNHRRLFQACGDIPSVELEQATTVNTPPSPRPATHPVGLRTRRGDSIDVWDQLDLVRHDSLLAMYDAGG